MPPNPSHETRVLKPFSRDLLHSLSLYFFYFSPHVVFLPGGTTPNGGLECSVTSIDPELLTSARFSHHRNFLKFSIKMLSRVEGARCHDAVCRWTEKKEKKNGYDLYLHVFQYYHPLRHVTRQTPNHPQDIRERQTPLTNHTVKK